VSDGLDDAELMERLAEALAATDPVPEDVATGAQAAFIARDLDHELAQLEYDSAQQPTPVLTRGSSVRSLSFTTDQLRVELEFHSDPSRLVGQLIPAQSVALDLEAGGFVVDSTTTDDLGRFRFDRVPTGSISIVCRAAAPGSRGICSVDLEL
jgi:hypothetical protein